MKKRSSPVHLPRLCAVVLAAAFLLAIIVSAVHSPASPPGSATARISAIEVRTSGRLGVAALNIANGQRIEHRANERFPMCSTFKFLAASAVLHRVDRKQDHLDRFVPYSKDDLLEYAPVTKEHVKDGGMTLAALCAAAVTYSDNTAGNLLLREIGGPDALTHYARSLGDQFTRLDRTEPDLNSAIAGDVRDTTTPAAMVGDMQALLLGQALSSPSRSLLDAWLTDNKTGASMIRAGLPADWHVGDKTGRGAHGAMNDVAIIRPPNRPPILLAIYFVESQVSVETRTAAIAEVASIVAESFQKK